MKWKHVIAPARSRGFLSLWLSQTLSQLGDQCYSIALIWLIIGLTGSTLLLGSVLAATYIPTILLLILGGAWADRIQPGKILLWSDTLRALLTLVFSILVSTHIISVPEVFLLAMIYGLVAAFFDPAFMSLFASSIPSDEFNAASSLQQFGFQTASLFGPPLGGFLIARFSIAAALIFDALTFFISVVALILIRRRQGQQTKEDQAPPEKHARLQFSELTTGFLFLWQEQGMLAIALLFSFTNALNDTEAVLVPILVRSILKLSAVQFGLMASFLGIGTIIGSLLMGIFGKKLRNRGFTICASMIIFGASIFLMGLAKEAWQLYIDYFILGLSFIIAEITSSTLWLQIIPEQLRGRVFSTLSTFTLALNPLGFLFAGLLGSALGVSTGLLIGGTAIVIISFLAFLFRPVRRLDKRAEEALYLSRTTTDASLTSKQE